MMRNNLCVGFVGIRVSTFVLLSAIMVLLLSAIACSSSGTDDPAVDISGYSLSYKAKGSIGAALDAGPIWDATPTATYEIAPALPPELGLTFNTETGNITGTPKTGYGGLYTVSATATSPSSGTVEAKVFITVFMDPIVVSEPKESIAIGTRAELMAIGTDATSLAGTYHLTADIDLDDPEAGGANWEPLGSEASPFTGTLHGNGHAIYNLKIAGVSEDSDAGNYQGLFAKIGTAKVENLGIGVSSIKGNAAIGAVAGGVFGGSATNIAAVAMSAPSAEAPTLEASGTVNISGTVGSYVGGLVGHSDGTVSGYATGAVTGTDRNVGGLVGYVYDGTVSGYATGAVTGTGSDVGGLVGYVLSGTVSGYATGAVTGTGGLVGYVFDGTVSGYATGAVTGTGRNVGGLVGTVGRVGTVSGYATGAVTSTGNQDVGGLVGLNAGTVSGYWDQTSTKQSGSSGGVGISATANIVYDATDSKYTDSKGLADATQHVVIFDNAEFLKYFDLTTAGAKTWPKLKASITIGENTFSFTSQPTVSDSDADATIDVNW